MKSKTLLRQTKLCVSVALFFSGTALASSAAAGVIPTTTVTVDGISYDLTTVNTSYTNDSALFIAQPWWGNLILAGNISLAVGFDLGFMNNAISPPVAYGVDSNSSFVSVTYLEGNGDIRVCPSSCPILGEEFSYIIVTPVYTLQEAVNSLNSTSLALDSTIISTSALVNGAHSRPMSRRVAKGEKTFWLAGDWGNVDHGSQSGSTGLAEVSGGYNFGPVQVNASLGKYWGSSNLVNNGDIDSDGNYIMVEGIVPVSAAKGLYATVGTFYQSGEVDIDRAYLVLGAVEESSASPDSRTWGLRARLDWENAFAYKSARFSPYADIWHSRAKLDGYTETGGGFPARFDSREDNITELRAGLNLALPTSAPAVEFVANIEGVHRFTSSADSTTGEIIGIGSFDLDGQDYRQNWLKGGVGLEAKIGQGKGSLMLNGTTRGEAASAWLAASYQMTF